MDNKSNHQVLEHSIHGTGEKKLLLIPGFMVDRAFWKYQVEHFTENHTGYENLVINNHGMERNSENRTDRSIFDKIKMSRYAQDVLDILDHYRWETVNLVGISMGGMISMRFAVNYPDRVKTMTLINTHSGGWMGVPQISAFTSIISHAVFPTVSNYITTIFSHRSRELSSRIINEINEDNQLNDTVGHSMSRYSCALYQAFAICGHYMTEADFDVINGNDIPTLIVAGLDDAVLDPKNSLELHRLIKNSELFVIQDTGHLPIIDDHGTEDMAGHIFNRRLARFLESTHHHREEHIVNIPN